VPLFLSWCHCFCLGTTVFVLVPLFHNQIYSIKDMTGQTWCTCIVYSFSDILV
jgi:hypothetical protein